MRIPEKLLAGLLVLAAAAAAVPHNKITAGESGNTDVVLYPRGTVAVRDLIGNRRMQFGPIQLHGGRNEITVDAAAVIAVIDAGAWGGDIRIDLNLNEFRAAAEGRTENHRVGIRGHIGTFTVGIELDFEPGMTEDTAFMLVITNLLTEERRTLTGRARIWGAVLPLESGRAVESSWEEQRRKKAEISAPPDAVHESLPEIVKRIIPSTVVIYAYDRQGELIGLGSGFFVHRNGDIVTNRHVLRSAFRAEVKTQRAEVFSVSRIVAEEKDCDIVRASVAILQGEVRPLSISSEPAQVGERVLVVGNPLGLEQTVSEGIVSAVRDIPVIGKVYQITAPISPGSSGSPVINMRGQVIGVATFQASQGQNLNFAVPGERVHALSLNPGQSLSAWNEAAMKDAAGPFNFLAKPVYGSLSLQAGFDPDPRRFEIAAGGANPVPTSFGGDCGGFVNTSRPSFVLNYSAGPFDLLIYIESRADTTLLVLDPQGRWHCNDDDPGRGLNPTVRIARPRSGSYYIWVGTMEQVAQHAVLFISERGQNR